MTRYPFKVLLVLTTLTLVQSSDNEDARLTIPQIINKNGYPCEEHFVVTPDGYVLRIHRIPSNRWNSFSTRGPVYLQHGILASSADWIIAGPDKALAYQLSNAGYDVWMGNSRGNALSRNHTRLNPDTSGEFWDFSWHEMGIYDLPTSIDYVLRQTNQNQLYHIGFSQGTTSFYVMASMRPEYNRKIKAHFSLAPIAFMGQITSPLLRVMALWRGPLGVLSELIGLKEFLPKSNFFRMGGNLLCGGGPIAQMLCVNSLFAICGFSVDQMNVTLLPIISGHTPAGAATKQLLHYGQLVNSGYFRLYNYGPISNMRKYGSLRPPDYPLDKITAPVYLINGDNDWLSHPDDVKKLDSKLGNSRGMFPVAVRFNHLDFVYGISAKEVVYDKVITLMEGHR